MAGVPDIIGTVGGLMDGIHFCDGAFTSDYVNAKWNYTSNGSIYKAYFRASQVSSIYGSSETVTPLSESCLICIRY